MRLFYAIRDKDVYQMQGALKTENVIDDEVQVIVKFISLYLTDVFSKALGAHCKHVIRFFCRHQVSLPQEPMKLVLSHRTSNDHQDVISVLCQHGYIPTKEDLTTVSVPEPCVKKARIEQVND